MYRFVVLKKTVVIFLILQIFSNYTFADELIKIPRLFTHYYHHTYEHRDTKNFIDFIQKHYTEHNHNSTQEKKHAEDDNDCKLPFKHCNDSRTNIHTPAIGFVASYLTTNYCFTFLKSDKIYFENKKIESSNLSSIWQPPKIS